MAIEIREIPPPEPPKPEPTYTLEGLDKETCVALRSLLYFVQGRAAFPGLEDLHTQLQIKVGNIDAVLGGDFLKVTRLR